MFKTLDNLHIDVLAQIFDQLYSPYTSGWDERWWKAAPPEEYPAAGLLPLSLVCRTLRVKTLPWIFRDVKFSLLNRPREFIPHNLWPYIRVFRLMDTNNFDSPYLLHSADLTQRKAEYIKSRNELQQGLPQLPYCHTAHLIAHSLSTALIQGLISMTQLSSVVMYDRSGPVDEDLPFSGFQKLRTLIHVVTDLTALVPQMEEHHEVLGRRLFMIIQRSAPYLVHLDIPFSHTKIHDLGHFKFPALRCLILRGCIQPSGPNLLLDVLNAAPSLQVLEIHLIVFDTGVQRFMVMTEDIDIIPQYGRPRMLSNLRQFTFANAHPDDLIFRYLPSKLQTLSLPVIIVSAVGSGIVSSQVGGRLEFALSQDAASNVLRRCTLPHVVEFRISIEGELPPLLFDIIAEAFPFLRTLEVRHRLRVPTGGDVTETQYPPKDYVMAFASFRHLQVLNLNWPLTLYGHPDLYHVPPDGHVPPFAPSWNMIAHAALFARSVPSLVRIGLWETMLTVDDIHHSPCIPFSVERSGSQDSQNPVIKRLDSTNPAQLECSKVLKKRSDFKADCPRERLPQLWLL